MPHFTDDDQLITSDEIGTTNECSPAHQEVAFVVDGDCTTLDNGFAALKGTLPAYMPGKGITQSFQYIEEADSIDPQDAISAELHHQVVILSNAIRYIRHLELCKKHLHQEKATLKAEINRLSEGISDMVATRGVNTTL
jgi:hypothetical protein